jgi:hypothetical protein
LYLHEIFGVRISGGNSSRRNVLSTVHFSLSNLLSLCRITPASVYSSFSIFKSENKKKVNIFNLMRILNSMLTNLFPNLLNIILKGLALSNLEFLEYLIKDNRGCENILIQNKKDSQNQLNKVDGYSSNYSIKTYKKYTALIQELNKDIEICQTTGLELQADVNKLKKFLELENPSAESFKEVITLINKVKNYIPDIILEDNLLLDIKSRNQVSKSKTFKQAKKYEGLNNN